MNEVVRSAPAGVAPRLRGLLAAFAVLIVAVPAWLVAHAPPVVHHRRVPLPPARVVPQAELPEVEPMKLVDLDPDDARAFNATVPFSTDPNPAARPFHLSGGGDDRARAIDCMASAVLYEAGDEPVGQRAVAQVVINRVRHPAFPKSICGVVYQGSDRSTGCQFTFTCDGALENHHWSEVQWMRARRTATAALSGAVFRPVGYSTHYHTDWVVPYWQSSLDKVAAVDTHLFFRWTGWWGTPPAFNRHVDSSEPVIAKLALYSDAHRTAVAMAEAATATATADDIMSAILAQPYTIPGDPDVFLVTLDPKMAPEAFAALATKTCGDRAYCKLMGWTERRLTPVALPLQPQQITAMSFSYLRDRARNYEKTLWNCTEFKRKDDSQCMKKQLFVPVARLIEPYRLNTLPPIPSADPPAKTPPPELSGVRRKDDPKPPAQTTRAPLPPVSIH